MRVLERTIDVKNTFEAKFLATFVSVVLVLSGLSVAAFAEENGQALVDASIGVAAGDGSAAGTGEAGDAGNASAGNASAPAMLVGNAPQGEPQPPVASAASAGSGLLAEANEAVITFVTQNAFASIAGQPIAAHQVIVLLHKDLAFTVEAEPGYEMASVTAKNSDTGAAVEATKKQDGSYHIAAANVSSKLVVEAKAVQTSDSTSNNAPSALSSNDVVSRSEEGGAASFDLIHTVTFEAEGSEPAVQKVFDEDPCVEPFSPPVPEGFNSFLGWFEKNANGTLADKRFDFGTPIVANITLVAKFSENWVVQFEDADGKIVVVQEVANNGKAHADDVNVTAPDNTLFSEWRLDGVSYNFDEPVTKNITLKPHFTKSHFVYFISKGSAVAPQTVKEGDALVNPTTPRRAGYDFLGWSTDENATTGTLDASSIAISGNTVLYGVWKGVEVGYSVVYWFEKPNIVGDAGTDINNYLYNKTESMRGVAGSTVSAENLSLSAIQFGYFSHGDTVVVSGAGTTVLNVYFKRDVYNLQFTLGAGSMNFNGETYDTSYSFKAKYEQNISDLWASSKNATFTHLNASYKFCGWVYPDGTQAATHRLTLTADIANFAKATGTVTFPAKWATSSNNWVNYWLQVPDDRPYQNLSTDQLPSDVKLHKGKYYSNKNDYTQFLIVSGSLSPKVVEGFTCVDTPPKAVETRDGLSVTVYNFYYTRSLYNLSFDTQGGSAIATQSGIRYGVQLADRYQEPTRDGYIFKGWFKDAAYKIPFSFETATMPNSHLKLFAKWESSQHVASFFAHDGDETPVQTQGVAKDDLVRDPGLYVIGKAYEDLGEFLGWRWYPEGSGSLYTYFWEQPVQGDLSLIATWRTDGFTLTYDKGLGQGTVPADSNPYDLGVNAPIADGAGLTAPGKTFVGWRVDGTGRTYYPGNTIKMNGSTKLVARFVDLAQSLTLTFDKNDEGTASETQSWTAEKNETVALPGDLFMRDEFVFAGWNTARDGSGTSFAAGDSLTVTKNGTVLYAQWKPKTKLVLEAASASKVYDGAPLAANGVTLASGELATGDKLVATASGSITNVSDNAAGNNPVTFYRILRGTKIVTDEYQIDTLPGTLAIEPKKVIVSVKGNTLSGVYDATEQSVDGYEASNVAGVSIALKNNVQALAAGTSVGTYYMGLSAESFAVVAPNHAVSLDVVDGSLVIAPAGTVGIVVGGDARPYDGTPLIPSESVVSGLLPGDRVEFAYSGSQTDAGSSSGTVERVVVRNAAGENATSNYSGIEITPGTLTITPKAVTITVDNASKVAGADDPAFAGTVTGLVKSDHLGSVTYRRTNDAVNEAGTYEGVLVATYADNKNYAVEVVPGTFTITPAPAETVTPATTTTPPTTTPPTTPETPAVPPTSTIGELPEGHPILSVARALEQAIAPVAAAFEGRTEQDIKGERTPLSGYDVVNCWVHYYIIIGIITTMLYGAGVLVRRISFTRKLKGWEADVRGESVAGAVIPGGRAAAHGKAL